MQVVFGVYRMPLLVPLRRLHIGRTCHDELVNGLQPPALSDKFGGQPIEEIMIGWPVPDAAEIIAGFDQPNTEVVLPEAVYDHPCQQSPSTLINVRQPPCQPLPAVSPLIFCLTDPVGDVTAIGAEDSQNSRSNIALFLLNIAPAQQWVFAGIATIPCERFDCATLVADSDIAIRWFARKKKSDEAIVITLRDWVIFVVVTSCATDGQAKECGSGS